MRALLLLSLTACAPLHVQQHSFDAQDGRLATYLPPSPTGPVVLLFPADGNPFRALPRTLAETAAAEGWVLVGLEPPGPVSAGCWWSPHKGRRSAYVVDVVEALLRLPGTRRDQVVLAGWSGGAFFAAGVPFHVAPAFSGGIVGVCGGDVPREESGTDWCAIDETLDDPILAVSPAREAAVAAGWRVDFTTTQGDEWTPKVDGAAAYWRGIGAPVHTVDAGPGGHCDLDVEAALIAGIRRVLEAG